MYFLFIFILLTSKELKFEFTLKNRKKNLETYFSLDKYIFEVKSNSEDRQCIELCLIHKLNYVPVSYQSYRCYNFCNYRSLYRRHCNPFL